MIVDEETLSRATVNAMGLLRRIYLNAEGRVGKEVQLEDLHDDLPRPEMVEGQSYDDLAYLGLLWIAGFIQLLEPSVVALTQQGKERVESFSENIRQHGEEHPEMFADDVSDDVH